MNESDGELTASGPLVASQSRPLYLQIAERLESGMKSGVYPVGHRFPTEPVLAASFGVSRLTLRHSLTVLEHRGLIDRIVGRRGGTFVREAPVERDLTTFAGFTEQMRPVALERSWFPDSEFPGLLDEPLDGALYDLLRDCYGRGRRTRGRCWSRSRRIGKGGRWSSAGICFLGSGRGSSCGASRFQAASTRQPSWDKYLTLLRERARGSLGNPGPLDCPHPFFKYRPGSAWA